MAIGFVTAQFTTGMHHLSVTYKDVGDGCVQEGKLWGMLIYPCRLTFPALIWRIPAAI